MRLWPTSARSGPEASSIKPELGSRRWQAGFLDIGVSGVSINTSTNPLRSWQLAIGSGTSPVPARSAGACVLFTVPSCFGTPDTWQPSSFLILGDAALGWEGWWGCRVLGQRGSQSEAGEPDHLGRPAWKGMSTKLWLSWAMILSTSAYGWASRAKPWCWAL